MSVLKPLRAIRLAWFFMIAPSAWALDSVLALHNPATVESVPALYARIHYFVGNDPLPMREYEKNWQGDYQPRKGNNIGLMSARAEFAGSFSGIEFARLRRLEGLIQTTRSTTDLYRIYKTKGEAAAGTGLGIDAHYQLADMSGWRLGYSRPFHLIDGSKATLGVAWSRLEAQRVRAGEAVGLFESLGSGDYRYRLAYEDAWHQKTYPFQTPGMPAASGNAFDIGLHWLHPSGLRVEAVANDLATRLHWRNLPTTTATANSGQTSIDASGYLNYQPVLSGRNARQNLVQHLPERWAVEAAMPWRKWTANVSLARQEGEWFPLLGLARSVVGEWRLQGDYDTRLKTFGFKLAMPWAYVSLRVSDRDLSKAHAYGVSAGASINF